MGRVLNGAAEFVSPLPVRCAAGRPPPRELYCAGPSFGAGLCWPSEELCLQAGRASAASADSVMMQQAEEIYGKISSATNTNPGSSLPEVSSAKGPDLTLTLKPRPPLPALATAFFCADHRAGVSDAPRRWVHGVTQFPRRLHARCTASTSASRAHRRDRHAVHLRCCAVWGLLCLLHLSLMHSCRRRTQRSTSRGGTAAAGARTRTRRWRPLLSRPSDRCPPTLRALPSLRDLAWRPAGAAVAAGAPMPLPVAGPGRSASLWRPPRPPALSRAPRRAA